MPNAPNPQNPPPPASPPPTAVVLSTPWWKRIAARWKLPGWAWVGLAIVTRVPDWVGRADFWRSAIGHLEGNFAVLPSIVASPYFSVGLLIIGLAYLVFVGEPKRGVQRHAWWPYVGWISIGVFGLVIFSAFEAGIITSALVPERHLSPRYYRQIVEAAKKSSQNFRIPIAVSAADTPEASGFAIEIMTALRDGGLPNSFRLPGHVGAGNNEGVEPKC